MRPFPLFLAGFQRTEERIRCFAAAASSLHAHSEKNKTPRLLAAAADLPHHTWPGAKRFESTSVQSPAASPSLPPASPLAPGLASPRSYIYNHLSVLTPTHLSSSPPSCSRWECPPLLSLASVLSSNNLNCHRCDSVGRGSGEAAGW